MQDPYTTLGLEYNAEESEIRERYLELVRRYPPEHEPAKAAEIRAAYDSLRDPVVRLQSQLFDTRATHTLEGLINEQLRFSPKHRLPTQTLLSLGES